MWCIIQDLGKGKATVHKSSKEWKSLFQGQKNNIICFHSSPKMNKPKNFNVLPERARRITEMVKDLILVVDLIELATENKEKIEI